MLTLASWNIAIRFEAEGHPGPSWIQLIFKKPEQADWVDSPPWPRLKHMYPGSFEPIFSHTACLDMPWHMPWHARAKTLVSGIVLANILAHGNMACHGMACHGMPQHAIWHGMAWHGMPQHATASSGSHAITMPWHTSILTSHLDFSPLNVKWSIRGGIWVVEHLHERNLWGQYLLTRLTRHQNPEHQAAGLSLLVVPEKNIQGHFTLWDIPWHIPWDIPWDIPLYIPWDILWDVPWDMQLDIQWDTPYGPSGTVYSFQKTPQRRSPPGNSEH